MSEQELGSRLTRRTTVAIACLALGLAGVAWSGCGGSSSNTTKSAEEKIDKGLEEVKKGVNRGVEEAKQGLKKNSEARKHLENAQEEVKKGLEKGKEEAHKAVEEVEKYAP